MALPYKLFKNFSIDGETFGLDPDLGKMLVSTSKTGTLSANSWFSTDAFTIPEDGMYLVAVTGVFGAGTTTGATRRATAIIRNGGSPGYQNVFIAATNEQVGYNDSYFMYLTAGTTIRGTILSGKASASSMVYLEITKILKVS